MDFLERAKSTIAKGVPVIRLQPRAKAPLDSDWPALATTDLATLEKWNSETPEANCGSVAKAELGGTWFFEFDSVDVPERIFKDTGHKLTDVVTYKVRSSPGKGHIYFRHNGESIALGNIAQGFVKSSDWSARVDRQFVVSAHSLHPRTETPYEVRTDAPIIEAPPWLIDWLKSQRLEKKILPTSEEAIIIHEGGRNSYLASVAGKLRQAGLSKEALESALLDVNQNQCQPPLRDDEVRTIAHSIAKYEKGKPDIVYSSASPAPSGGSLIVDIQPELEESAPLVAVPYPKFPEWVMQGTSIYEGLVKPICDQNSRYAEFMWLPALTILLNYLGTKVRIERKNLNPSIFMVSIGRRGKVIKSSSVEDAIQYFNYAGVVGHNEQNQNNADGRALVFTPASPEGLGKEMQRTNCKNSILFYDELSTLASKASIDSSTLTSTLLTLYEGGKFQNLTKTKDSYSILPGTYCTSLIACSTDRNFTATWSKLAGKSTGLDDRFFFLLQPEVLKPLTPLIYVPTQDGAIKTRQLIDRAIQKGVYGITDSSPLNRFTEENNDSNRAEHRAEKFALGLAVDLGLDDLDEEVIERALAIVAYELAVKKYLRTYESDTREGSIQMEILYNLRRAGGWLSVRDLQRVMNITRYGTSLWSQAYLGLYKAGWIKEEGSGVKGDPKKVILLRVPEDDD